MIKPEPVNDMIARISSLSEQELDILLATLTSQSEKQQAKTTYSIDKNIIWLWVIIISTFIFVETAVSLIKQCL